MTGVDTNILVRYFLKDDAVQSSKATDLIERRFTVEDQGFISVVVMMELVWVLSRIYKRTDEEVARIVRRLLQIETLVIQHEQEVFTAAVALGSGVGSFDDALIGALSGSAGCISTLTFDQKALRLGSFERL